MYAELLRIKRFREDKAQTEVIKCDKIIKNRKKSLNTAKKQAADYHNYRIKTEDELFVKIKNQLVLLHDLEDMNRSIDDLRATESLLEAQILNKKKQLNDAIEQYKQAKEIYQQKLRSSEKFVQFIDIQNTLKKKEHERLEEKELEDFSTPAHPKL